jgi:hypothetical protein
MAKQRAKRNEKPSAMVDCLSEIEASLDRIHMLAFERLANRLIAVEAALDFYAYGPASKGAEPMRGEEYAKAMVADGGRIARAYLEDRFDQQYYGVPKKGAPGGWGSLSARLSQTT